MSDEQILQTARATGLGDINPALFRTATAGMNNMNDEEFEGLQKMAKESGSLEKARETLKRTMSVPVDETKLSDQDKVLLGAQELKNQGQCD